MAQTQFGENIKWLCSDNGKEYVNHNLFSFTSKQDIIHEFTYVDTPQQMVSQKKK